MSYDNILENLEVISKNIYAAEGNLDETEGAIRAIREEVENRKKDNLTEILLTYLEDLSHRDLPDIVEDVRKIEEVLWNVKVELVKYFKKRKEYR